MSDLLGPANYSSNVTSVQSSSAMQTMRKSDDLMEVAQAFEGLFLQQLVKAGRASSIGDQLIDSSAVKTSQDLLDTELTKASSKSAGLGISDAIYRQFSAQVIGRK